MTQQGLTTFVSTSIITICCKQVYW